jgi:hypothetical protein
MAEQAHITHGIRAPIARPLTVADAYGAFQSAAAERHGVYSLGAHKEAGTLDQVANVLARAFREIEPLMGDLDLAADGQDEFTAASVDTYAAVEALFWENLSGPAQTLLKALISAALRSEVL